jgi:uncharacterized protein involved in exopolysaccharide biosynthesis
MPPIEPTNPPQLSPPWYPPPDSEISLYDIAIILVRRKWILLSVAAVVFGLATGYALLKEPVYEFYAVIEIGQRITNGELVTIESAESISGKLNQGYIPEVIADWQDGRESAAWLPQITARAPADGDVVIVSGHGAGTRRDDYVTLLAMITQRVIEDYQDKLVALQAIYQKRIEEVQVQILTMSSEVEGLNAELKNVSREAESLQQQYVQLNELLEASLADLRRLVKVQNGEAEAIAQITLGQEIRDIRARRSELRDLTNVILPERKASLLRAKETANLSIDALRNRLGAIELERENITSSRTLIAPRRSLEPVGKGPALVAGLGFIVGVFLGIFAAFFVEFIANTKKKLKEQNTAVVKGKNA